MRKWLALCCVVALMAGCKSSGPEVPVIGFVDAFEDNTIEQARVGFMDALSKNGFDEKDKTIKIIYRNAQGNIPILTQVVKYFISQKVKLIASNPSISTITALQNTDSIPVFMMVSPTPDLMKVVDDEDNAPSNLFGVAENLDYIDTSFLLIPSIIKPKADSLVVGMIFNQSEPQSVEAKDRIEHLAKRNHIKMVSLPVNNSADVKLVTESLLTNDVDAFFANPDNTVFASFETIVNSCEKKNIPVFTSEAGLVARGAVAAFGADIYQWGYEAGEQAAQYLKSGSTQGLKWSMVTIRKKVYNDAVAKKYQLSFPETFEAVK